jgi:NADH-quinone oxidoreductase subunit J
MTEVIIFLVVGGMAVLSAALMLISQNAIHSALFLVVNFICVAFFFLTLGAPFIAIAQVAVYAGAIMVLFLFVIMLLGAERLPTPSRQLPWLPAAALGLALVFLVTVGVAIAGGKINVLSPPADAPRVRLIHAAEAPPVDVYFNNTLVLENVDFRQTTDYVSLPAGEYGLTVFPAGADPALSSPAILGEVVLLPGELVTLAAVGADGRYQITALHLPPGPVDRNQARLTLVNGLPESGPVDLVDAGAPSDPNDDRVLLRNAPFAEPVEVITLEPVERMALEVRATLPADAAAGAQGARVAVYRALALEANSNNLLIIAPERLADGSTRIVPLHFGEAALPLYGSPAQIGAALFTTYLLPFEIVGILLLVAIIGAVALTREELVRETQRRKVVRRPLIGPQAAGPAPETRARDTVGGGGGTD